MWGGAQHVHTCRQREARAGRCSHVQLAGGRGGGVQVEEEVVHRGQHHTDPESRWLLMSALGVWRDLYKCFYKPFILYCIS